MPATLSRRMLALFAVTCGSAAANAHFSSVVTPLVAQGFAVSPSSAAPIVTASQFGCGAGIFLLVPLADRLAPRHLVVGILWGATAGLLVAATASNLLVLVVASVVIGAAAAVPPIVTAMAVGLASAAHRGFVAAVLFGGATIGIVVARGMAGALAEWCGWRMPYVILAGVMAVLAATLAAVFPPIGAATRIPYPALLRTTAQLWWTLSALRRRAVDQAIVYGCFMAAWTGVVLVCAGSSYGGGSTVSLIAWVCATGVAITPLTGRRIDRSGSDLVSIASLLAVSFAGVIMLPGSSGGMTGLSCLILGMTVLDAAMRVGQIANQTAALALQQEARGRVNTAFMGCVFLGGGAGSLIGLQLFHRFGWGAVSILVIVLPAVLVVRHLAAAPPVENHAHTTVT
ncbi:MFS transporter [Nocardia sp. NPDC050793]|uniref:MFS transporter n=1 Tax=Nocardia sp. NPDC050793 TaxID=3155159 RepID=UPI0033E21DC0